MSYEIIRTENKGVEFLRSLTVCVRFRCVKLAINFTSTKPT